MCTAWRFIPVHTGNIAINSRLCFCPPVYPCAYREHFFHYYSCEFMFGLSLCIQGTCIRIDTFKLFKRFIPVHTGNISFTTIPVNLCSVYPCAYREHASGSIPSNCLSGLSLCIQGTSPSGVYDTESGRFIPVHTGNMQIFP